MRSEKGPKEAKYPRKTKWNKAFSCELFLNAYICDYLVLLFKELDGITFCFLHSLKCHFHWQCHFFSFIFFHFKCHFHWQEDHPLIAKILEAVPLGFWYRLVFCRGTSHASHTCTLTHTYSWGLPSLFMNVQNCHLPNDNMTLSYV